MTTTEDNREDESSLIYEVGETKNGEETLLVQGKHKATSNDSNRSIITSMYAKEDEDDEFISDELVAIPQDIENPTTTADQKKENKNNNNNSNNNFKSSRQQPKINSYHHGDIEQASSNVKTSYSSNVKIAYYSGSSKNSGFTVLSDSDEEDDEEDERVLQSLSQKLQSRNLTQQHARKSRCYCRISIILMLLVIGALLTFMFPNGNDSLSHNFDNNNVDYDDDNVTTNIFNDSYDDVDNNDDRATTVAVERSYKNDMEITYLNDDIEYSSSSEEDKVVREINYYSYYNSEDEEDFKEDDFFISFLDDNEDDDTVTERMDNTNDEDSSFEEDDFSYFGNTPGSNKVGSSEASQARGNYIIPSRRSQDFPTPAPSSSENPTLADDVRSETPTSSEDVPRVTPSPGGDNIFSPPENIAYHSCNIDFMDIEGDDNDTNKTLFERMLGNENTPGHSQLLQCNEEMITNLDEGGSTSCCDTTLSSLLEKGEEGVLTVPCGTCVIVDQNQGEIINLPSGLIVEGMLYIPPIANVTIRTTHVFVMGGIFKADMRTTASSNRVKFDLYGDDEIEYTTKPEDSVDLPTCVGGGCNFGSKAVAVLGGRLEIQAYLEECPSWEKLRGIASSDGTFSFDRLIVSQEAVSCWGRPGTELVLSSPTTKDRDRQIVIVDRVVETDGEMQLQLFSPLKSDTINLIQAMSSIENHDGKFAIEVASLTRPLVFTSSAEELIGGHLQIYWTNTLQHIEGISINNFGQQGNLGRYPIHFHFGFNGKGSIVKKNVIRNSSQRCYVIHRTDYVVVEENVALDAYGHCYFLEDGIEIENVFRKNFGLGIKKMPKSKLLDAQSGKEESDHRASVYWISNPQNHFYNNIAAGSEEFGFWIEARDDQSTLNLYEFDGNEVHSCDIGFSPYPKFWYPYDNNFITNFRVYRNRMGMFLHNVLLLNFENLILADNGIHVMVLTADSTVFRNTTVIGKSYLDNDWEDNTQKSLSCSSKGFWMHPIKKADTYVNRRSRFQSKNYGDTYPTKYIGTTLENVIFENWCLSNDAKNNGQQIEFQRHNDYVIDIYNNPHIFKNVTFDIPEDKNRLVNDCSRKTNYTVIEIQSDSSIVPVFTTENDTTAGSGFLVSSLLVGTLIPETKCQRFSECLHYCSSSTTNDGICMRTLRIFTNAAAPMNYDVIVTDTNNPNNTLRTPRPEYRRPQMLKMAYSIGAYGLALPSSGDYTIHFEDPAGKMVFPDYAIPVWEQAPISCTNYPTNDDIIFVKPYDDDECSDLINNGSFESDIVGWQSYLDDRNIRWNSTENSVTTKRPSQYIKLHCVIPERTYQFTIVVDAPIVHAYLWHWQFDTMEGKFELKNQQRLKDKKSSDESNNNNYYTISVKWKAPKEFDVDKLQLVLFNANQDTTIYHASAILLQEEVVEDIIAISSSSEEDDDEDGDDTTDTNNVEEMISTSMPTTISSLLPSVSPSTSPPSTSPSTSPTTTITTLSQLQGTTNIALNKTAKQSSTLSSAGKDHWIASNAIDGKINTGIHTYSKGSQWWIVDLESVSSIDTIKIYNRQDCCQDRLIGAVVSILDDNEIDVVLQREIENDNDVVEFDLTNYKNDGAIIVGRYIRITLDTGGILNFNELEVYGKPM